MSKPNPKWVNGEPVDLARFEKVKRERDEWKARFEMLIDVYFDNEGGVPCPPQAEMLYEFCENEDCHKCWSEFPVNGEP